MKPRFLIPYLIPEEEIIPGRAVWYASVCRECPAGCGIRVRVREGRATKIEGNVLHPINRGSLCARGQAALQGLYNPDRIQGPMRKSTAGKWESVTWDQAFDLLAATVGRTGRKGSCVWMTPHCTGSIDQLVDEWLGAAGSGQRYRYEPFGLESVRKGNGLAFGINGVPTYDFGAARHVLSFGADFLETWISPVGFARGFSSHRGVTDERRCPFTYAGPRVSMTASRADTWLNIRADAAVSLALAMVNVIVSAHRERRIPAADLEMIAGISHPWSPENVATSVDLAPEKIIDLAQAFASADPGLALAGGACAEGENGLSTVVAVNLLNYVCGNVGRTVRFGPLDTRSGVGSYQEISRLISEMEKREVDTFFFTEVNPAYSMPSSAGFVEALSRVPLVVACSSFMDETTALASLVLPVHAPLESWGDFEPQEGVEGLMQPVVSPVFNSKGLGDILLETAKRISPGASFSVTSFHEYTKRRWMESHASPGDAKNGEAAWIEALARGGAWKEVPARPVTLSRSLRGWNPASTKTPAEGGMHLLTYPSIACFDGRGANRPWLQELPDPLTRRTWDSWLEINPSDASRLGVRSGELIKLTTSYGNLTAPAFIYPGLHEGYIVAPIGQGHSDFGRYARGVGSQVMDLLDPKPSADGSGGIQWCGLRVDAAGTAASAELAQIQESDSQSGRGLVREQSLGDTTADSTGEQQGEISLYRGQEYPVHRWGMVIDLDRCTGCGACVTACTAENNVPIAGREGIARGRDMAWIRIDRYFEETGAGERKGLRVQVIPVLCQHCAAAPCETVCPVYAAVHTPEGLNGQVYNRCIGTRYCENNCPYKVRRFNWFSHEWPEPLNWQLNPEVTVRTKGVMEKCTFCVQRIVEAKNSARMDSRPLRDGDIETACQQTCPSQAIVFGDLKDPGSQVSRVLASQAARGYHLLGDLNTQPAITYLKRIRA